MRKRFIKDCTFRSVAIILQNVKSNDCPNLEVGILNLMLQRRRKVLLMLEAQPQKQLGFFGSVCRSLRPAGWFLVKKIMQRKPRILFSTFATPLLSPHCLAKKPMSFSLAGTLSQGWFLYVFVLSPIAGTVPGRTKFVFRVPPKNLWEFPKLSPKEESLEIQRDVYCAL